MKQLLLWIIYFFLLLAEFTENERLRHLCCLCVHFAAQQSIFFHSKLFPLLSQLATAFPILSLFIQSAVRLNLLLLLWLLEWTRDSMQQVAETPTFDWACLRRVLNFRNTGHIEDSFRVKISWADSWCASLQTPTSSSHIQRETYTLESLLPPALLSPLFPAPFLSFSLKLLYHTSQPTLSSTCSTLLAHASSPLYHILHCALLEVPETLHLLYVSSLQPHSSSRMPFVHTHGFRLAAFSSVNLHLSRLPPTRSLLSLLRERRQSSANITVHWGSCLILICHHPSPTRN